MIGPITFMLLASSATRQTTLDAVLAARRMQEAYVVTEHDGVIGADGTRHCVRVFEHNTRGHAMPVYVSASDPYVFPAGRGSAMAWFGGVDGSVDTSKTVFPMDLPSESLQIYTSISARKFGAPIVPSWFRAVAETAPIVPTVASLNLRPYEAIEDDQ